METEFNTLYDYALEIHNAFLASFLRNIQQDRSVGTIFKLIKVTIIKNFNQYEMIHLVKFSTNLSIDELCHFFHLNISDIRYISPNRRTNKNIASKRWALLKKDQITLDIFKISNFFKYYDETHICDMFNLERAYRYNPNIWQLIELHYFKRADIYEYFTRGNEFNLNELLIRLNLSQISIFDVAGLLQKFGEHFTKIVIEEFEQIVPITFFVRRKVNLILLFIERFCPAIDEIIIDHEYFQPLESNYELDGGIDLVDLCKSMLTVYVGEHELERFLQLLYSANIMFHVRKVKNFKLKCCKKITKMIKLLFSTRRSETLAIIQGFVKPESFPTMQIAFEWHQDAQGNSWKGIPISKLHQAYISYMFTEINLLKYYNLFDLLFLDEVFYDINNFDQNLIYNQILLHRPSIVNPTTGEFKLNEILLNFQFTEIPLKSLLKILRIFGGYIKIFHASKNVIDFPMIYNSNPVSYFNIILYYLCKYCKNLEIIKFDDQILEGKLFKKCNIKLKNLLVTNYNANELFELFKSGEHPNNMYNEINIKKFTNLTELEFVKTLCIKNLSKLILNSNYTQIINWAFLQDTKHLKLDKFHMENTLEIKLHHIMYNLYRFDSACDTFIAAILKFFKHFNLNTNFVLNLVLVKCALKNFTVFNYLNLERIVFNDVNLTSTNLIELGKCYNLKSVTFIKCDKLTDDYLMYFIKNLEYNIKEIKVDNCLVTNAFFYQFAAHEIEKFKYRIYQFWFSSTRFSFKNCPQITMDWEHEEIVISNDDSYISRMEEFENNHMANKEENLNLLDNVYDEEDFDNQNYHDYDEDTGYDFYN